MEKVRGCKVASFEDEGWGPETRNASSLWSWKEQKKKKGRESFSPTVSIKEHSPADTSILVQQDLHHTSDLYTGLEDNNFVLRH